VILPTLLLLKDHDRLIVTTNSAPVQLLPIRWVVPWYGKRRNHAEGQTAAVAGRYTITTGGQAKQMADAFEGLTGVMILAVILVYMIMAASSNRCYIL